MLGTEVEVLIGSWTVSDPWWTLLGGKMQSVCDIDPTVPQPVPTVKILPPHVSPMNQSCRSIN
jgi:hypothetical protein